MSEYAGICKSWNLNDEVSLCQYLGYFVIRLLFV